MPREEYKKTINESFLPLLRDRHRYLVLCGGAGSGKSNFAGRKIIERCAHEEGHRILCLRKTARSLRHSVFAQLCTQLENFHGDDIEKIKRGAELYIRFKNSSEIIFSGLDDVEKLKSIYGVTSIWIEEASEIDESDFNQIDLRLRGKTKFYKQIILTFNPISVRHWLKRRFFDSSDERALTHRSTYLDNRFLDEETVKTLLAFKDKDEYFYRVYCLGQWGTLSDSIFSKSDLLAIIERDRAPECVGIFEYERGRGTLSSIRFTESESGFVRIFSPPEPGREYIIAADTAGTGSDYFVAQVVDLVSGAQAAVLRVRNISESDFAAQLFSLGTYYNTALIAVETNFSSYPALELSRLGYPRLYVRQAVDSLTGRVCDAFGFRTDSVTRPVIISELVRVFSERPDIVVDPVTADEMLTFVRNEKLRPEAEAGCHDDTVISLAIAHYLRSITLPSAALLRHDVEDEPRLSEMRADERERYLEECLRFFENNLEKNQLR